MRSVYNFATIEAGPTWFGPRVAVGVLAIRVEDKKVKARWLDPSTRILIGCDGPDPISEEITRRIAAAGDLNGVELFRTFISTRQSKIVFKMRGTRFDEHDGFTEMMDRLFQRLVMEDWRALAQCFASPQGEPVPCQI